MTRIKRPGAVLSERETAQVLERLRRITAMAQENRIKEQCRLVACTINTAGRRTRNENKTRNTETR